MNRPGRMVVTIVLSAGLASSVFITTQASAANECDGLTPTILGTPGDDPPIFGTSGPDVINALGGDDVVAGAQGDDVICGGEGDDSLNGGGGADRVFGDADDDNLNGGLSGEETDPALAEDVLDGGPGNDIASGGIGDDQSLGGPGVDLLRDSAGVDVLNGGPDSDYADYSTTQGGVDVDLETGITVTFDGDETVIGVENVNGTPNSDSISGDDGPNVIDADDGQDFISGGDGSDVLSYLDVFGGDGPVQVDFEGNGLPGSSLGTASGADGNDQFQDMENVFGTGEADDLRGDGERNAFAGFGGDDEIDGRGGGEDTASFGVATGPVRGSLVTDVVHEPSGRTRLTGIENLEGSSHDDTLIGDIGDNDLLGGEGEDELYGRDAFDHLAGGPGEDRLFGGAGTTDFASFADLDQGIHIDLGLGSATSGGETDRLIGVEGMEGTQFPDVMNGDAGENHFSGLDGDDQIDGGPAMDFVLYRQGPDVDFAPDPVGPVEVDLGAGTGLDLSDTTAVQGDALSTIEVIAGTPFNDVLQGGPDEELLFGFGGDDQIFGGGGDDGLNGGEGADLLDGEEGLDLITYMFDNPVEVDLEAGTAQVSGEAVDELVDPDVVIGSDFPDVMKGSSGSDFLIGNRGKDKVFGADGDDALVGGGVRLEEEGNLDSGFIPINGKDKIIDGQAGSDHCLGQPQKRCEFDTLTDEQEELLSTVAKIIDDIKRKNGVRVN